MPKQYLVQYPDGYEETHGINMYLKLNAHDNVLFHEIPLNTKEKYYLGYVPRDPLVDGKSESELELHMNMIRQRAKELIIFRRYEEHIEVAITIADLQTGDIVIEGKKYRLTHLVIWALQGRQNQFGVWASLKAKCSENETPSYLASNISFHMRPLKALNHYDYAELYIENIYTGKRTKFHSKREIETYLRITPGTLDRKFSTKKREGYKGYRLHIQKHHYYVETFSENPVTGELTLKGKLLSSITAIGMFLFRLSCHILHCP